MSEYNLIDLTIHDETALEHAAPPCPCSLALAFMRVASMGPPAKASPPRPFAKARGKAGDGIVGAPKHRPVSGPETNEKHLSNQIPLG